MLTGWGLSLPLLLTPPACSVPQVQRGRARLSEPEHGQTFSAHSLWLARSLDWCPGHPSPTGAGVQRQGRAFRRLDL
jgi:hypothetical protein